MDFSKTLNGFVKIVTWISLSWAYRLARFCKVPPYKTAPRWQEGQKVSEINQAGEKRQIGQICTFQFFNLIFSSLTCRKEIIGHMVGVARIEGWKCHLSIDKTLKKIFLQKVWFSTINIKHIPVCRALKDQPVLGMGSSGAVKIDKYLEWAPTGWSAHTKRVKFLKHFEEEKRFCFYHCQVI